ncbi:MAG: DUF58 domain-containing protein [Kangiellaceae bacterium]
MHRLIDPKTIARIKDLPLVAKTIAEGFLIGHQASTQRGVGLEFSQYRAYQEGDELNRIDWKLFARSDRYYVREAERESEIDVWFLLDSSASMLQHSGPNGDVRGLNKLEYAKHLIASLSYIANKQGDSFGLVSLNDKQFDQSPKTKTFVPSGKGERHWQRLLIELSNIKSGVIFPKLSLLKPIFEQMNRPSIIFVLSDFYQQDNEITNFVSKLNSNLSEVIALPLNTHDELTFNYSGPIRFKDLESEQEILVSAKSAKQNYLQALSNYKTELKQQFSERNISHYELNIDEPLDAGLFAYLKHRQRRLS